METPITRDPMDNPNWDYIVYVGREIAFETTKWDRAEGFAKGARFASDRHSNIGRSTSITIVAIDEIGNEANEREIW